MARVGPPPIDIDDPLEIAFANGALFHVEIGREGATDIRVGQGGYIENAFGHLRADDPQHFAETERTWTRQAVDLPWLLGATLSNPRRLTMTQPYTVDVGYAFDVGERTLALFGEADLIFIAELNDPEIASFKLEVGAGYSATLSAASSSASSSEGS